MCNKRRESVSANATNFKRKPVNEWKIEDVAEWLDSLDLSEYRSRFMQSNIAGAQLLTCDRTLFTQLGVTRIAHRQLIEQSLKSFTTPS